MAQKVQITRFETGERAVDATSMAGRSPLRPEFGPAMIRAWCLARTFDGWLGSSEPDSARADEGDAERKPPRPASM